jgi:basic membrane protein A
MVDPAGDFRAAAESGPDLIVSDAAPTRISPTVFSDFPDVKFAVIDGFIDSPNTAGILFANEEGSFLAGAAAALKSETGTVGFVGGIRFDSLERFRAGFEAGARFIDPEIEILSTYVDHGRIGDFLDAFARPDLGEQRATALYELGADVIFQAAGSSGFGVFSAAVGQSDEQGRHLWAIGVDNDQWFQVDPDQRAHLLTSMIKRGDIASYLVTRQFLAGEFTPGAQEIGMADDAFDFSTQGNGLTASMVAELESLKAGIANGRITVPDAPSGELLDLDALPDDFDDVFADLPPDQIADYFYNWLIENYRADAASECFATGTVSRCGQFMIQHFDEWHPSD